MEQHGLDGTDGIEGLKVDNMGVYKRRSTRGSRNAMLLGIPYHHSAVAAAGKDQFTVQVRTAAHQRTTIATTVTVIVTFIIAIPITGIILSCAHHEPGSGYTCD